MNNYIIALLTFLFLFGFSSSNQKTEAAIEKVIESVVITPDQKGFMLENSCHKFNPWGMNYGHYGMLLEDSKSPMWDTLDTDLRNMKNMGFNVVRVHVQFDEFMSSANSSNKQALSGYKHLLELAHKNNIYLDITGLACYRPAKRLYWYDSLNEADRWNAQACFWEEVAKVSAGNNIVFCYNLINEPTIPTSPLKKEQDAPLTEAWYSGSLGGFDFCQYITLDPNGRSMDEIRHQWIRQLTTAIRKYDSKTLITVGLLPWPNAFGNVDRVATDVDFISIHIYPDENKPKEAMDQLANCDVGKPVVIEETYALTSGMDQWVSFMHESRSIATGWFGHYLYSYSLEELDNLKNKTIGESLFHESLRKIVEMKPLFSPDSENVSK